MTSTAELEELVRQELRPTVEQLVRKLIPELVAEALNGHARPTAVQSAAVAPTGTAGQPSAKTCRVCGRSQPDARFDADRRTCRACRASQQRARKQADVREADQPADRPAEVVERAAT